MRQFSLSNMIWIVNEPNIIEISFRIGEHTLITENHGFESQLSVKVL